MVIDSNRVEALPVTPQGLQPVARRDANVIDVRGRIDDEELAQRGTLDLDRQALTRSGPKRS